MSNVRKFKKLPAKFNQFVMPLLLSWIMTAVVSLVSTIKAADFKMLHLDIWLSSWILSWLVAFPILLMTIPFMKKVTSYLVETH